jgi:hypothetical protein
MVITVKPTKGELRPLYLKPGQPVPPMPPAPSLRDRMADVYALSGSFYNQLEIYSAGHKRRRLTTINDLPGNAWLLGLIGDSLLARRADMDYICDSCDCVIASIPKHSLLSNYRLVQYEAFNEYCPEWVPGLPDYAQPYTTDPHYMDFFKPKYNIVRLRSKKGNILPMKRSAVVICYNCGAKNA